jgi:hypothetical protein
MQHTSASGDPSSRGDPIAIGYIRAALLRMTRCAFVAEGEREFRNPEAGEGCAFHVTSAEVADVGQVS